MEDLLLKVFPLASQAEGVVWVEIRLEKGWLLDSVHKSRGCEGGEYRETI